MKVRKIERKIFTPFFLCLIALTFSSCNLFGGNTPVKLVKAPASKQVYIAPETGITDFTTLDPALATDQPSINAIAMIFTGLVSLNDKLEVQPQLAQTWSLGSDGVTWTFHLKPNLKFSDGTSLTANDVVYSLDRALQPVTQSSIAPIYLALIKDSDQLLAGRISTLIGDSLLAPNASTVEIVTRKKAAYFPAMLTNNCAYVVEKSLITTYGVRFTDHLDQGGGAGPFKVLQYVHGQKIEFVPNHNYYGALPQLQKVIIPFYSTPDQTYQAYLQGQVQTTGVPLSIFGSDKKRSDFHEVPQLWIDYYTMNYLVKPFDNIDIRRAFALAIDKMAIANTVWKGSVIPTNHIVPQGMPGYNPNLTGPDGTTNLKGNPTLAKSLLSQGLQQEGWSSVSQMPPITLTYATGLSTMDQEVTALIQMWQQVLGVRVTPAPVDYNTLLDRVTAATNNPNGLQFWGLAWVAEYPDPQDWLTRQFDQASPNNNMNYGQNTSSDAARQQLTQQQLENADATMQQSNRFQAYAQAEQQLVNDVAWLPMYQTTSTFLRSPFVVGIADNAVGITPPDDWANIYVVQAEQQT
ncbi:MAG TPA: peptide ABC transporter substrate-binding protein [Ktedonobacteraceae bacterium]|nr:peptide ABC transporter substrate-binding protein [Ktedonobacteraceae bacterium]